MREDLRRDRDRSRGDLYRGGRRDRDRSPRRRSRDRRRRSSPPAKRRRSPPSDRAEHEIYIGNYPVEYGEEELKKLFTEYGVEVGILRMKSDGHKVFAFAEAPSMAEVEKAVANMDSKEIEGRRLRVRGSKDTDKKREDSKRSESKKERERKRKKAPRVPKVEDSKRHLVAAFVAFIDRELAREESSSKEGFQGLLEASKTALISAFDLPEDDDSLKVDREIEDIFFRAARMDIKLPEEPEPEAEKAKEEGEGDAAVSAAEPADSKAEVNGDDKNAEVKEGEAVAAPMETEEVQADSTEKEDDDVAVVEAVNDESLMADLENALAAGEEDEEFIEQDRQNQLLDAEDADEVEEVGPEGDAVAEVKEDEPAKEVAKTPGRGRGRGRRGKRT